MASPLRLTLVGPLAQDEAGAAWRRVSDEFDRCEEAMSRFREDSAITHLNQAAGRAAEAVVDDRLYRALAAAHRAWRVTGGRFDPRVVEALERIGYAGARLETPERRPPAGSGDSWLQRRPREHELSIGEHVDLGGIGKGLALRWAWRRLQAGLSEPVGERIGALLEAGGDLILGGPSPDAGPWQIGLEDPGGGDESLAVASLTDGALCTSSVLVNRWRAANGRAVHHLIDPVTGAPSLEGLLSVTVAGPDPAWAEVWSKALFLEGVSGIAATARARGLRAWWVEDDGTLRMTPGARPLTIWTAGDR